MNTRRDLITAATVLAVCLGGSFAAANAANMIASTNSVSANIINTNTGGENIVISDITNTNLADTGIERNQTSLRTAAGQTAATQCQINNGALAVSTPIATVNGDVIYTPANPSDRGTLVITKGGIQTANPSDTQFVATPILSISGKPINLATSSGREQAEAYLGWIPSSGQQDYLPDPAYNLADVLAKASYGTPISVDSREDLTTGKGTATFKLPMGIYLITETDDVTRIDEPQHLIQPFMISMPFTNPIDGRLECQLIATPKLNDMDVAVDVTAEVINDDGITSDIQVTVDISNVLAAKAHVVAGVLQIPDKFEETCLPNTPGSCYRDTAKAIAAPSTKDLDDLTRKISFGSVDFQVGDLDIAEKVTYTILGSITCPYTGKLTFPVTVSAVGDTGLPGTGVPRDENNYAIDDVPALKVCNGTTPTSQPPTTQPPSTPPPPRQPSSAPPATLPVTTPPPVGSSTPPQTTSPAPTETASVPPTVSPAPSPTPAAPPVSSPSAAPVATPVPSFPSPEISVPPECVDYDPAEAPALSDALDPPTVIPLDQVPGDIFVGERGHRLRVSGEMCHVITINPQLPDDEILDDTCLYTDGTSKMVTKDGYVDFDMGLVFAHDIDIVPVSVDILDETGGRDDKVLVHFSPEDYLDLTGQAADMGCCLYELISKEPTATPSATPISAPGPLSRLQRTGISATAVLAATILISAALITARKKRAA